METRRRSRGLYADGDEHRRPQDDHREDGTGGTSREDSAPGQGPRAVRGVVGVGNLKKVGGGVRLVGVVGVRAGQDEAYPLLMKEADPLELFSGRRGESGRRSEERPPSPSAGSGLVRWRLKKAHNDVVDDDGAASELSGRRERLAPRSLREPPVVLRGLSLSARLLGG